MKYTLLALITLLTVKLHGQLYWTDFSTGKIQSSALTGGPIQDLVTGLSAPSGVALDSLNGKIYWTDRGSADKIQRSNLDGSQVEDIVTSGLSDAFGLTVDPVEGKLYWVDARTNKVQRSNLDGTLIEDLVTTGLGDPEGIAIDTKNGHLYWTNFVSGDVQRSNLDGTNVTTLYNLGFGLEGIALDVDSNEMYIADGNVIYQAMMDGSDVSTFISGLESVIGVAYDEYQDALYWVDQSSGLISMTDVDNISVQNIHEVIVPKGIALIAVPEPKAMALGLSITALLFTISVRKIRIG